MQIIINKQHSSAAQEWAISSLCLSSERDLYSTKTSPAITIFNSSSSLSTLPRSKLNSSRQTPSSKSLNSCHRTFPALLINHDDADRCCHPHSSNDTCEKYDQHFGQLYTTWSFVLPHAHRGLLWHRISAHCRRVWDFQICLHCFWCVHGSVQFLSWFILQH